MNNNNRSNAFFSIIKASCSKLLNRLPPKFYNRYSNWKLTNRLALIQKIIDMDDKTRPIDNDDTFNVLQKHYSGPGPYPYDSFSVFQRGVERALDIINITNNKVPGLNCLEAGCGDGMVSLALDTFGHAVSLADMEDWRDPRAKALDFTQQNFSKGLPFNDNFFDVVFSYNSFEHFDNPEYVFNELVRVTKKDGIIFLSFGPLYASPWGLHAYRTLLMPYSQFLFSQPYIEKKLDELGINDLGKKRDTLQPLNRWTVSQFKKLWQSEDLETLFCECYTDMNHLNLVLEYPEAFRGRGIALQDLYTHSIKIILRRQR